MDLATKVAELNRVGKALSSRLKHLGVETVKDLLFYFPFRYEDYSRSVKISELKEGEQVTVRGRVELIATKRSHVKRKLITEAVVADDTGRLRVVWFGQPFISKIIKIGDEVFLSGKARQSMLGFELVSPAYEKIKPRYNNGQVLDSPGFSRSASLSSQSVSSQFVAARPSDNKLAWLDEDVAPSTTHTARIVPMYSLTSGITQKQLRFLMSQIIHLANAAQDWLPEEIRKQAGVVPLAAALRAIHFPSDDQDRRLAERRLKFDELFVLQLRAEMVRQSLKLSEAPRIAFHLEEVKKFVASLPFILTVDQRRSAWEILQDCERCEPMNRLLEGDVGSGKTVVSALSMYNAVISGYQAALMAPTEVLATQHFVTLNRIFENYKIKIALLTGSKAIVANAPELRSKTKIIEAVKSGEIKIVLGTHALLNEDVQFCKLAFVIVDEQHRFGVEQRKILREKSGLEGIKTLSSLTPHFLSMTATPIPRSFALTLYGDLDISIIKELPSGRKQIMTRVVAAHQREKAYRFIREQIKEGRQVFVICPLIEDAQETDERANGKSAASSSFFVHDKKSVLEEYERLSKKIFSDLRVGYLHGKMKTKEKDEAMDKFTRGEIDLLVSTSVVEVGVDIPNASVMMIESAERFGLAQLHQFRGRVGRSSHQSYCFLFTESLSRKVAERLEFFEKTADGFALAEYDLQTRGPGEVYGTTQSGMMNFRLATMKDVDLIKLARDSARGVDFALYPALKAKVDEWERSVHLE